MKNIRRFKIGDWVMIRGNAIKEETTDKDGTTRRLLVTRPFKFPRLGRITGVASRYDGRLDYDWECGNTFIQEKCHAVWCIRLGLKNSEIYAFDEDVEPIEVAEGHQLPVMYSGPYPEHILQEMRETMRDYMKDWPRDKKGRWTKAVPVSVE